jgi:hypothetical protein
MNNSWHYRHYPKLHYRVFRNLKLNLRFLIEHGRKHERPTSFDYPTSVCNILRAEQQEPGLIDSVQVCHGVSFEVWSLKFIWEDLQDLIIGILRQIPMLEALTLQIYGNGVWEQLTMPSLRNLTMLLDPGDWH